MEQHEPVQHQSQNADLATMSYTTIPFEVLEAAGIDINNPSELTEEQLNTVMSLIRSNGTQSDIKQHQEQIGLQSSYVGGDMSNASSPEISDRLTLYVLEDGSLKLTDAALQKEFLFTPGDLALQNIDVDNLTDESLQRVVQMAMESNDLVIAKRRRVEEEGVGSADTSNSTFAASASMELPAAIPSNKVAATEGCRVGSQLSLIGTEVVVKRDGKMFSALIRYCRQNGGYKVQFSDGHFEWVNEDEIQLLDVAGESSKKRSDHESYSEAVGSLPSGNVAGGSKNVAGRKFMPQIPGIKVISTNEYHRQEEPNFCCVICDQKVYQKEPQYIVIRIPACDKCAEQKMIVLEGSTKECGAQTSVEGNMIEINEKS